MRRSEFYFTLHLTESEHSFVESMIREYCSSQNLEMLYYRKFKTGHQPMWREAKIKGEPSEIKKFQNWCGEEQQGIILQNFWRTEEGIQTRYWEKKEATSE